MPTPVINSQRFYLDYRKFYETRDLLFVNSLGGIETLRLRGQADAETEYERIKAEKVTAPEYFSEGIYDAVSENIFNAELEIFKGDTGFMAKDVLDRLRDLFNSKYTYEIKNDKLIPISINNKNTQWYTNRQKLYSLSIQWQHAFTNESYSPAGVLASGASCPAVESLIVRQSGNKKLSVAWALETGYDKISIQINFGGDSVSFIYTGNHGQKEIDFENPAAPGETAAVEVIGKTVCNEFSDPMDLGPPTTVNITVNGNIAPTANPDTFNINKGYSSPVAMPYSVLDNDYDSNGDPVAAVPVGDTLTANGGTYSIDAAGIITYLPPSPTWEGSDTILYTVTETGPDPLTAISFATIVVGGLLPGNASTVYVKTVIRNWRRDSVGYYGEVWLEFYSDAAGTNPVDVTGIGLTINVRKQKVPRTGATITTDTAYAAQGIEMRIYDGPIALRISTILPPSANNYETYWTVLPGTGYQAI